MFIEQAINPANKFWKYLVGSIIIILASFLGQIPWGLAVVVSALRSGRHIPDTTDEIMGYFDSNLTLFLLMISFVVAIAAVYFVVRYFHHQTFLSVTTARKKVDWSRILYSFGIWSAFSIVSIGVAYAISPENFIVNFRPVPFAILALVGIPLIPIQTSTEEYVFRGYLMQGFGNLAKNRWFPLMMTSLIFGLMHIANPEVDKMGYIILIYYVGTGFFLGIITLMDDGMELALGFHAANNLIGALLVTADWSAFRTDSILKDVSEPTAGYDVLLPVLIIYPILLFIFSRKYKWTQWREKLTGKINNYGNAVSEEANSQPYIQ